MFQKRKAIAAIAATAIVKEWNVKDMPYQALS